MLVVSCSEIEKYVRYFISCGIPQYTKFDIVCHFVNILRLFLFHYMFWYRGNETSPHQMVTKDCINGTWFPKGHFGRTAGYSDLIDELGEMRENKESREPKIHLEAELMIYNRTK